MMTRDEIISACYQIPGQTWPTELGWLYDELQNSKSHVEIGTYCGRSLLASCGGMSDATVISVDNFSASSSKEWVESVLNATLRMIPRSVSVRVLQMHSIDAARQCCIQGLQFDSLFIDGCHEYAECKADIEAWRPMIKPGGLLCGHDYWAVHIGVMDAVNQLLPGFRVFEGTRIWYVRI